MKIAKFKLGDGGVAAKRTDYPDGTVVVTDSTGTSNYPPGSTLPAAVQAMPVNKATVATPKEFAARPAADVVKPAAMTAALATMSPADKRKAQAAMVISTAAAAAGAYHGYKRTGSVGWAFGWFLFSGLMPIFAAPIALVQGFGKRSRKA